MHFDALIRKFRSLPTLHSESNFDAFTKLMVERISKNVQSYLTTLNVFNDTHWFLIYREPAQVCKNLIKLSPEEDLAFEGVMQKLHKMLDDTYRVVYIQLAWIAPGEKVLKHADLQHRFSFTRRFNIVMKGDGLKYTCYHGKSKAQVLTLNDGDVFELNNRSYHEAENVGSNLVMILVIDFIEKTAPLVTNDDTPSYMTGIAATTNSPVEIWV